MTKHIKGATEKAMSRHLMALLTFLWLLPLVYFIPPYVANWIANQWWCTVISVAIIVPIISYLALPFSIKVRRKLTVDK